MKMYRCNDCGRTFEYPKIVEEMLGYYGDLPYYEPFAYCPHCNGDDFEDWYTDKVKTMDGHWVAEDELICDPISDTVYLVESIWEDDADVLEVMCGEDGEVLKDGDEYVYGSRFTFTREAIEEKMEGM